MDGKKKVYGTLSALVAAGVTLSIVGYGINQIVKLKEEDFQLSLTTMTIQDSLLDYQSKYMFGDLDPEYGIKAYNYMEELFSSISNDSYDRDYLFGNTVTMGPDGEIKYKEKDTSGQNKIIYRLEDSDYDRKEIISEDDVIYVNFYFDRDHCMTYIHNNDNYTFCHRNSDFHNYTEFDYFNEFVASFNADGSYNLSDSHIMYYFNAENMLESSKSCDGYTMNFYQGNINVYQKYNPDKKLVYRVKPNGENLSYKYYLDNELTVECSNSDGSLNYRFYYVDDKLTKEEYFKTNTLGELFITTKEKMENGSIKNTEDYYDIFGELALRKVNGIVTQKGPTKYYYDSEGKLEYSVTKQRINEEIHRDAEENIYKIVIKGQNFDDDIIIRYYDYKKGIIKSFENNSEKIYKTEYNGKKYTLNQGDSVFFYPSGCIEKSNIAGQKVSYYDNEKEQIASISNNQKDRQIIIFNGFTLQYGESLSLYEDGSLKEKYVDGIKISYFQNQKIHSISLDKDTEYYVNSDIVLHNGDSISFYENDNISHIHLNDVNKDFYEDGQIKRVINYGEKPYEFDNFLLGKNDSVEYFLGKLSHTIINNIYTSYLNGDKNLITYVANYNDNQIIKNNILLEKNDSIQYSGSEEQEITAITKDGIQTSYYDFKNNKVSCVCNYNEKGKKYSFKNITLSQHDSITLNEDGTILKTYLNGVEKEYYNYEQKLIRNIKNLGKNPYKYGQYTLKDNDSLSFNNNQQVVSSCLDGISRNFYDDGKLKSIYNGNEDTYLFRNIKLDFSDSVYVDKSGEVTCVSKHVHNDDNSIYGYFKTYYYDYNNKKIEEVRYEGTGEYVYGNYTLRPYDHVIWYENGIVKEEKLDNIEIHYREDGGKEKLTYVGYSEEDKSYNCEGHLLSQDGDNVCWDELGNIKSVEINKVRMLYNENHKIYFIRNYGDEVYQYDTDMSIKPDEFIGFDEDGDYVEYVEGVKGVQIAYYDHKKEHVKSIDVGWNGNYHYGDLIIPQLSKFHFTYDGEVDIVDKYNYMIKYYDFKKNSIKELISVHGQYFGDIWFEPGEAIAFNPDGSVQYIYQNGSYRVPNNETQESFKIR